MGNEPAVGRDVPDNSDAALILLVGLERLDHFNQVRHFPNSIRYARCHCGRHLQGRLLAGEVVEHGVKRDSASMVFNLLAVAIGQSREPAHMHPHREVLPFNV